MIFDLHKNTNIKAHSRVPIEILHTSELIKVCENCGTGFSNDQALNLTVCENCGADVLIIKNRSGIDSVVL